jgi:hypothetical protein
MPTIIVDNNQLALKSILEHHYMRTTIQTR